MERKPAPAMLDFAANVRQNARSLQDWPALALGLALDLASVAQDLESGRLTPADFAANGAEGPLGYIVSLAPFDKCLIVSAYLGRSFALVPSGKYYTPYACSNVAPCPACQGEGERPNPAACPDAHAHLQAAWQALILAYQTAYGAALHWPDHAHEASRALQRASALVAPRRPCPYCDATGSREAYLDAVWYDTVGEELDAFGLTLESGEGDPTDLYVTLSTDLGEPLWQYLNPEDPAE